MSDDRIGSYRIVRTLHPGATCLVMEVEDVAGRRFALKQLLASRCDDKAERKLFDFEARLGQQLQHPNLVRVTDYAKDEEQPYFVMDFFSGYTLRTAIAQPQKYPIAKGMLHRVLTNAAKGLAYMHDQGWVHRDIKPENILLNRSGEVKVIDYTITMRPRSALMKMFGGKLKRQGTPSYMSPEQIRCESPAIPADVYSFGITCYEAASGRPPFRANSTQELLTKHLREAPAPPTFHNPDITPEFSELTQRMIRKDAKDRPADLHEFLREFRRIRICKSDPSPSD